MPNAECRMPELGKTVRFLCQCEGRRPVAIRIPCKAKPCVTCGHKKTDCHASVRTGSQ